MSHALLTHTVRDNLQGFVSQFVTHVSGVLLEELHQEGALHPVRRLAISSRTAGTSSTGTSIVV